MPTDPLSTTPFIPYHFTTLRGRKREFLIDSDSDLYLPRPTVSERTGRLTRRDALRMGLAAGAGIAVVGLNPRETQAGFWSFVGGAVFSGAIGWLVGKVLDRVFPSTPSSLGLRQVANAQPSKSSAFHNSYAEPYEITNRDAWIAPTYYSTYRCDFGVDYYLRKFDLNGVELAQIKREEPYHESAMLPIDLRAKFSSTYHLSRLKSVMQAYDIEVPPSDISYVQTVRDKGGREHTAFGVKRGEKAQFLVG